MTCPFSRLLFSPPLHRTAKLLAICVTGFRPFTSLGDWWCTGTETAFSTVLFSHTSHQHVAINCDVVSWSSILMSRDGNNMRLRRKRQWLQIVFNNTLNNRLCTVAPSAEQVGIEPKTWRCGLSCRLSVLVRNSLRRSKNTLPHIWCCASLSSQWLDISSHIAGNPLLYLLHCWQLTVVFIPTASVSPVKVEVNLTQTCTISS